MPNDAEARARLVHLLLDQSQSDAALAELDRLDAGRQPTIESLKLRADVQIAGKKWDDSIVTLQQALALAPNDAQLHALHGLALAYLGRKAEAVGEGQRALALRPITKDALQGSYDQHQLARIYLLVGEPEKALNELEPLLKIPYYLSPGWLKIDPTFDPLRKNPRFQKLVAGTP